MSKAPKDNPLAIDWDTLNSAIDNMRKASPEELPLYKPMQSEEDIELIKDINNLFKDDSNDSN